MIFRDSVCLKKRMDRRNRGAYLLHHTVLCVDSTKETTHFLDVASWFLLKDGRNTFFHCLRPVGINQHPIQSDHWIAYAHLRGLTMTPIGSRQDKSLSRRTWCSSYVLPKTPMSSWYTSMLLSPCRTCSIICCAKSGAHFGPMGKYL